MLYQFVTFEEFAATVGIRLRAGLVATYGPDLRKIADIVVP